MAPIRPCLCIALISASAAFAAGRASLPEYVNFAPGDSANLAAATVERFLWKSSFECPYTVIRPEGKEVKAFVVLLHGAGDNTVNFSKIAGRLKLPAVAFLLPRGPFATTVRLTDPISGLMEPFAGYSWVDAQAETWPDRGVAFSAFLVARLIEQVKPAHAPGPPVVLVGFRQGGGLATLVAASRPGGVRALVVVSAYADSPVQEALRAPWATLADVPCLAVVRTDAPDAAESGHLAATARRLGARLRQHYLPGGTEHTDEDYGLIRSFIHGCLADSSAATERATP